MAATPASTKGAEARAAPGPRLARKGSGEEGGNELVGFVIDPPAHAAETRSGARLAREQE
jgi:hypothetical protein